MWQLNEIHIKCVPFVIYNFLEMSVYTGSLLLDYLSKFSIQALPLTSCAFPQTQGKLLGTV